MVNIISFPNIGINDLHVNRIAFSLFGRNIYWYGILITAAILISYFIVCYHAKKENVKSDDIIDLAMWVVIAGIIGARAYYVLTSLDKYSSFLDFFKIWEGGLGFYGCIIGGAAAAIVFSRVRHIPFSIIADMIAPTLLLAQAIGRWGNFFNAEAFGSVTTWDFFGRLFDISGSTSFPLIMTINGEYVTPTFLYEFIFNLVGFAFLMLMYDKKKFNGQIFICYIMWYGLVRTVTEGFRTDSLYIGSIRISQLIGLLSVIFGALALVIMTQLRKKGKTAQPFAKKAADDGDKRTENGTDN